MRAQQITLTGFLDVEEIVFGCDFTQRQNLYPVRLAVRRVHEKIAEVAQPFCKYLAYPVTLGNGIVLPPIMDMNSDWYAVLRLLHTWVAYSRR